MKNNIIAICLALFTFAAFTLSSCNDDDTTAPIVLLIGDATITISLGDTYVDQGATAEDDEDGDLTALIITDNPVNSDSAGTYTVTYSVSDAAGNPGGNSRTVIVEIVRDSWVGQYDAEHDCPSVGGPFVTAETMTAGAAADGIVINNFSGTALNAVATVSGQTMTIGTQTVGPFVFSNGTGSMNDVGDQINLTYTSDGYGVVETCTAVYDKL